MMKEVIRTSGARIEVTPPTLFRAGAELILHACSLLRVIPVLVAFLAVSLLEFGTWTFMLPLLALGATAYFLPFGFGNAYVTRLVRRLKPEAGREEDGFVVQLTLSPRIKSGFRALVEDADDFGYLRLNGAELEFYGDAVKLSLPSGQIRAVRRRNIGLRGLFVYGARVEVVASGLPNVSVLEFAERSSWLLPSSRRTARKLLARLSSFQQGR